MLLSKYLVIVNWKVHIEKITKDFASHEYFYDRKAQISEREELTPVNNLIQHPPQSHPPQLPIAQSHPLQSQAQSNPLQQFPQVSILRNPCKIDWKNRVRRLSELPTIFGPATGALVISGFPTYVGFVDGRFPNCSPIIAPVSRSDEDERRGSCTSILFFFALFARALPMREKVFWVPDFKRFQAVLSAEVLDLDGGGGGGCKRNRSPCTFSSMDRLRVSENDSAELKCSYLWLSDSGWCWFFSIAISLSYKYEYWSRTSCSNLAGGVASSGSRSPMLSFGCKKYILHTCTFKSEYLNEIIQELEKHDTLKLIHFLHTTRVEYDEKSVNIRIHFAIKSLIAIPTEFSILCSCKCIPYVNFTARVSHLWAPNLRDKLLSEKCVVLSLRKK